MKYYMAPLEGITTYVYRNAYHSCFHKMDKYFTPFLQANKNKNIKSKGLKDVIPEHNQGLFVVPQILTNNAEDFIWTAKQLEQLGYSEINLNLGCPSRTVVTKFKGSGFLAKPEELNQFLNMIFEKTKIKISIKTRIGLESAGEFTNLLEIYNQYPLAELIIHPRTQKDYYSGGLNLQVFQEALEKSKNPICYNGDIVTVSKYEEFRKQFSQVNTLMLGRGIIANPSLIDSIETSPSLKKEILRTFHDKIYYEYQELMSGDRNVLFKMKEIWFYMVGLFEAAQKLGKKIRKVEKMCDYDVIIDRLFEECDLKLLDRNRL